MASINMTIVIGQGNFHCLHIRFTANRARANYMTEISFQNYWTRGQCSQVKVSWLLSPPEFCTLIIFILLSPILLRKQTIAETLHCNGDLRFFGDPFPESLVQMQDLRKTPKPSKSWTYEDLLFRNMKTRITNLIKPQFWKLLWQRWICRGCSCRQFWFSW